MRLSSLENFRWYGMVAGLAAVLLLLAVLQYRSGKAVSQATSEQMRVSLQGSLMDVRQGLDRELTPLCRELQSNSDSQNDLQAYLVRFKKWRNTAAHPGLVKQMLLWRPNDGRHPQLFQLNSTALAFVVADWPQNLTELRGQLMRGNPGIGMPPGDGSDRPPESLDKSQLIPESEGPPDNWQNGRGPAPGEPADLNLRSPDSPHGDADHYGPPHGGQRMPMHARQDGVHSPEDRPPEFPWMIDQRIPALIHPVREFAERNSRDPGAPALGWVLVILDRDVLTQHILPELVQRYFGTSNQSPYEVAIVDLNFPNAALYANPPGFGLRSAVVPDEQLNLFGRPDLIVARRTSGLSNLYLALGPASTKQPVNGVASLESENRYHNQGLFEIDPIHDSDNERSWEIIATHREGSVEAAVASLWRRNLMFNFAVLLVLAATMAMIIATSVRGRRFARLQMDFVANVSHELRTPLTGIISAAQNIADGLIDDKQRLSLYGKAIVSEAGQLSELVEQILLFSATQKDLHRYHMQPVIVADVIHSTMLNLSALIQAAGITVEQQIEPGLPPVSADRNALSHCLQNLIANSVKYGGDAHWVGIHASLARDSNDNREVRISISDKGIGIGRQDLDHIFEPFYRTAEVTAAQIRGSGLGLPLVRRTTEAMGGRITVQSEPGKGSTFTLHLPV
jgi:signal transduction histidine kinase